MSIRSGLHVLVLAHTSKVILDEKILASSNTCTCTMYHAGILCHYVGVSRVNVELAMNIYPTKNLNKISTIVSNQTTPFCS